MRRLVDLAHTAEPDPANDPVAFTEDRAAGLARESLVRCRVHDARPDCSLVRPYPEKLRPPGSRRKARRARRRAAAEGAPRRPRESWPGRAAAGVARAARRSLNRRA